MLVLIMVGWLQTSEINLVDDTKLSVGDHQSEDDDDPDEDEESQQYSCQVADDAGVRVAGLLGLLSVATPHLGPLYVHVGELERSLDTRELVQMVNQPRLTLCSLQGPGVSRCLLWR